MMIQIRDMASEQILAQSTGRDTTLFGMWMAEYWPVSDFRLVLKVWLGVFAEFLAGFTRIT